MRRTLLLLVVIAASVLCGMDLERIDQYMARRTPDAGGSVWLEPGGDSPVEVHGFCWWKPGEPYHRIPARLRKGLSDGVNSLASHTSGGQLRFRTNSPRVLLRATLANAGTMVQRPFDLYVGADGHYAFYQSAGHGPDQRAFTNELFLYGNGTMQDFIVHFPCYNGVEKVEIGIAAGSRLEAAHPFDDARPIVVYGTSITQGAWASRPGNIYTNILSRRLNREFLNFGFSGSGRGEPEMAELLATIDNPAMYLIDYEANEEGRMAETLPTFLDILRKHHPETPILVLSRIRMPGEATYHHDALADPRDGKAGQRMLLQRNEVQRRQAAGDQNIFFFDGGTLLGDGYADCFTDWWHPNDLGFRRMADALEPHLRELLNK